MSTKRDRSEYLKKNAEKLKKQKHEWYLAHKEEVKDRAIQYYKDHPEKRREQARKRYWKHREEEIARRKKHYYDNIEHNKKYWRERGEELSNENHQHIVEYFREHPCVDCGETDVRCLEFDHVRGEKKFIISSKLRTYLWPKILKEIQKCEVRCANCHKKRHFANSKIYRRSLL